MADGSSGAVASCWLCNFLAVGSTSHGRSSIAEEVGSRSGSGTGIEATCASGPGSTVWKNIFCRKNNLVSPHAKFFLKNSVAEPRHLDSDPDPTSLIDSDPDPDFTKF